MTSIRRFINSLCCTIGWHDWEYYPFKIMAGGVTRVCWFCSQKERLYVRGWTKEDN